MNGLGEQVLGGEGNRLLPRVTAMIAHPLNTKAALYVRLPCQWLGGCLMELFKNVGDPSLMKNFRDITLADLVGQGFRLLRTSGDYGRSRES